MGYYEDLVKKNNEDIKITVGPVCKNCHHVIAYEGLVHCAELDCTCVNPEPIMENKEEEGELK